MKNPETRTSEHRPLPRLEPMLERRIGRTRLALFWERFWPASWPLMATIAIFLATALFGLWNGIPQAAKITGLIVFGLLALTALRPVFRINWPDRDEALRRIERNSGLPHRPATSYQDDLSFGANNKAATNLWQAHRERLKAQLDRMRAVWPRPAFARRDPLALRVPVAMGLVIAVLFAGPVWRENLVSPFNFAPTVTGDPILVDAWITPPEYTGQPPIFLTGPSSATPDQGTNGHILPEGSEFVLRAQGDRQIKIGMRPANGAEIDPNSSGSDFAMTAPGENIREYRGVISDNRHIIVLDGEAVLHRWVIQIIKDQPPSISLSQTPDASNAGVLRVLYHVEDDYGVVSGEGLIERAPADGSGAGSGKAQIESPLFDPPRFALAMPNARTRSGDAQVYQDLTAHPWAGAKVIIRLQVEDDIGQLGESVPVEFTLPSRSFTNPIARAIVEQRLKLALDPNEHKMVGKALDAITIAPEGFFTDIHAYLALRSARWRLTIRQDRDSLISVVDQLWQVALRLENGDLSDAEQALRSAQEALQDALARDASPEEVEQLVEELRQALNNYLQAMAENAQNSQQQTGEIPEVDQEDLMSSEDLARMLNNIENMARNGSRDEAQQLLSQLQDILENLRMGQMRPQNGQQRQMSEALNELGEMMEQQQQLMDESFRMEQQQGDQDGEQTGRQQQSELGDLQQRQADLQATLEQLMQQLEGLNSQAYDSFDDAKGNMGEALNSLGEGETGQAADDQGQALQNLRDGASSLAEQLAESLAQSGSRQGDQAADPLGRPRQTDNPDLGMNVEVPDEIDVQRAREILEELRRRFGQRHRPRIELDYFERLLRRF